MSLNLLGLGFTFGAKDKGLRAKQRQVASGFGDITDEVDKMSKKSNNFVSSEEHIGGGFNFIRDALEKLNSILRLNRLQTFIQSISLAKLGDIAHGVENIATNGLNLTTSFEETIVASNKTARSMGTNFGLAGKDLGRFTAQATSMGIALNIGADKASEATYNVTLAAKELGAVGLKSASDLAKFAEVSGISAGDITQTFKQAGHQFHLTDKQLRQLAGSALESGKQIGDIGGQFKQMPHILDLIARRAAVLGKEFSPQQMADFASQTLAVSGALYNMGASAEEAREAATSLAEKMVESGENFGNMFAGTSSELSDFHTALAIAGGDTKVAFNTMTQGPGEFMASLADMVSKGKKSGKDVKAVMNLMRGQLEKVFGAKQTARMLNFFETADTATLDSMKTVSKAEGDLGKFAKTGFSTGRSLAQSFDLMKDQFVMSFRNIGRSAAVDFVDKTGKEFNKFNAQMQAIVKKGGPLGKLIEKFSEIHQIGALALIPQVLRPMASVFGSIVKEAAPMVGVLGAIGFRFSMLASPISMVLAAGAVLITWFAALRMEGKTTGEAIKIMTVKIADGAQKLWKAIKTWTGKLVDYLSSIDWRAVFTRVFDALSSVMQQAGEYLRAIPWKKIFDAALGLVGKVFEAVTSAKFGDAILGIVDFIGKYLARSAGLIVYAFQKVFDSLAKIDIGKVVSSVVDLLGRVVDSLGTTLSSIVLSAISLFSTTASDGFKDSLLKIAGGIAAGAKAILHKFFDIFDSIIDYLGKIDLPSVVGKVLKTVDSLAEGLLATLASSLGTFFSRLEGTGERVWKVIGDLLSSLPDVIGKWLVDAGDVLKRTLPKLTSIVLDAVWMTMKVLPTLFYKVIKEFPAILAGIAALLNGAVRFLVDAVVGILQGIENWLAEKLPSAAGIIHATFTVLKVAVEVVGAVIRGAITAIKVAFEILWKVTGAVLSAIGSALSAVGSAIKTVAHVVGVVLSAAWETSLSVVKTAWEKIQPIVEAIGNALSFVGDKIGWLAGKVGGAASSVGGFFKRVGSSALDLVTSTDDVAGAVSKSMQKVQEDSTKRASMVGLAIRAIVDSTVEHVQMVVKAYEEQNRAEIAIASATLTTEKDKYAAIGAVQKKFASETAAVLRTVPESVQRAAEKAQGELNRAFYEQLKEITFNEKLSVDERQKALAGLEDWKRSKMAEFTALVEKQTQEITASGGASAKSMEDAFGQMVDGVASKADQAALKASAAVGTVQHELGVSAEEALNNLKNIAAIDPKKFASDLKVIKQVYIDFAKTAQDESEKMLLATGKAFEEFNKQAVEHWTKQKANVTLMTLTDSDIEKLAATVGATIDRAFAALTTMISAKVEDSVTKAFTDAFAKVIVQSKKFVKDSMDVFGDLSKQMVKRFGEAWTKILDITASAIAAIQKDSARVIGDLQRINMVMRAASSTQVQPAGANVVQNDVKLTVGKTELENIYQATHHPEWYEKDFKFRVMEILAALNSLAAALVATPRSTTAPASSSRSTASSIRNDIGIASNRIIARANGAVQ